MSNIEADKVLSLLLSDKRLDRDKGVVHLRSLLKGRNCDEHAKNLLEKFEEQLKRCGAESPWEEPHGCLLGAKCIVEIAGDDGLNKSVISLQVLDYFEGFALKSLTNYEVRVRNISGQLLGKLCKLLGSKIYERNSDHILDLLEKDLARHIEGDSAHNHGNEAPSNENNDASKIFHESAGWRHLETTMKCLQCMIEGCGKNFNDFVDQRLLDLLFKALTHTNRFVRETGFNVCAALVLCGDSGNNSILKYGEQFSSFLARGLSDNWSQVRLASSVATRNFLVSVDHEERKKYFADLIPRLCLNRYYIAEGVRIYSQETWRIVSDGHGKDIVGTYIKSVVDYYISATQADNHAVREAACACISELAKKIDATKVRPFVTPLLDALLECFHDDSWPVRDAACVACGNFILSYAHEAEDKRETLYRLFLGNLQDPIASVRKGASLSLANYTKVYKDQVQTTVFAEIEEGLRSVKEQGETGEKFVGLDKRPAQFGVVKELHSTPDPRHTDQQMYSCGSLAPKMGRGSRGGCSDCNFRRPSEPWERTDGCMCLLADLSEDFPDDVCRVFPLVVESLSQKNYSQHVVLLETFVKQIPTIATRIGKKAFKSHVETFLDHIFYALSCDVALTSAAAEECLINLAKFLGANILRGRIENFNPAYAEQYARVIKQTNHVQRF